MISYVLQRETPIHLVSMFNSYSFLHLIEMFNYFSHSIYKYDQTQLRICILCCFILIKRFLSFMVDLCMVSYIREL